MASIGINLWVWTAPINNASLRLLDKVADMGFDTVELPLESLEALDARRVARKLRETGLAATACGAFGPDRDLTSDNKDKRDNSLEYIKGCLSFLRKLLGEATPACTKRGHPWPTI